MNKECYVQHYFEFHLRKPSSTTCGLKSFSYFAAKTWNSLPEIIKTATSLNDFITAIRQCAFS